MLRKLISLILCFSFLFTQSGFAQGAGELNLGQYLGQMGSSLKSDKFRPLHLRYFSYDIEADNFQLLLDKGDDKDIDVGNGRDRSLQEKTKVLMEYFQIGLVLPNDKFWVNLRPDAQDQIIDPELEKTDLGKVMLEADLQLKKDTAQWTSPQTPEGRLYWDKLYQKAKELFGSEPANIPTITRPWIVPGEIIVREGEASAYIFKANLKVMLEEDYLSSQPSAISSQQYNFQDPRMKELNTYSTQLIRELIIPKLTKEVNTSKRYAFLRQVFFSLVMARWFKERFASQRTENREQRTEKANLVRLIDSRDLTNLISKEPWSKSFYFNEYKKSFAKGEYNLKENLTTPSGQVIRSYVSGGVLPMADSPLTGRYGVNKEDGSANIWAIMGIGAIVLAGLPVIYYGTKAVIKKGWRGVYYDLSEGKGGKSENGVGDKKIHDNMKTILDKYPLNYEIVHGISGKSNTYAIDISDRSRMVIEPTQINGIPVYKVKALFPFQDKRYQIFSVMFYFYGNGRWVIDYPPYLSKDEALQLKEKVAGKLDEILRSTGSSPLRTAEEAKNEFVKKITSLKEGILAFFNQEEKEQKNWRDNIIGQLNEILKNYPNPMGNLWPNDTNFYNLLLSKLLGITTSILIKNSEIEQLNIIGRITEQHRKLQESLKKSNAAIKNFQNEMADWMGRVTKDKFRALSLEKMRKAITDIYRQRNWKIPSELTIEEAYKNLVKSLSDDIRKKYFGEGLSGMKEHLEKSPEDRKKDETNYKEELKGVHNAVSVIKVNTHPNIGFPDTLNEKVLEPGPTTGSSALASKNQASKIADPFIPTALGGIDFRSMQMLIQPMGTFHNLNLSLPTLSSSALQRIDLDQELAALRNMVKAGLVPSGARVKEYLAALFQKGRMEEKQDDFLVCLAEIYRLAEEENLETSPELRESLVIADTGSFVLLPNNQKAGLN